MASVFETERIKIAFRTVTFNVSRSTSWPNYWILSFVPRGSSYNSKWTLGMCRLMSHSERVRNNLRCFFFSALVLFSVEFSKTDQTVEMVEAADEFIYSHKILKIQSIVVSGPEKLKLLLEQRDLNFLSLLSIAKNSIIYRSNWRIINYRSTNKNHQLYRLDSNKNLTL